MCFPQIVIYDDLIVFFLHPEHWYPSELFSTLLNEKMYVTVSPNHSVTCFLNTRYCSPKYFLNILSPVEEGGPKIRGRVKDALDDQHGRHAPHQRRHHIQSDGASRAS